MVTAFFYGTLMHPKILKRVIGHEGSRLTICPALLPNYTRHKINGADYPGIVPYSESRGMFSEDLEFEDRCVRGSVVIGLSDEDVRLLDIFEGDEYTRRLVHVHRLGPAIALGETDVAVPTEMPKDLADQVEVNTYVWCRPLSRLQPRLWTFEEFARESAWKWIGPASENNNDYTEVDRRRAMGGAITDV